MKKNEHPLSFQEFEAIYLANLQAADNPPAYEAYLRTEAAVTTEYGERKFTSYNSFKVMLHKHRARKANGVQPDKKVQLTAIISVVNTYVCTIDYPFLVKYREEIHTRAQNMEVFGPMNGTYNAAELNELKKREAQLTHLIRYIELSLE